MLSALSIPATTDKLGQLIEMNWAELEECESSREVKLKRKLLKGLATFTEEQIWEAVANEEGRAGEDDEDATDLRDPEWTSSPTPTRA